MRFNKTTSNKDGSSEPKRFYRVNLDSMSSDTVGPYPDLHNYILYRVRTSEALMSYISANPARNQQSLEKFSAHAQKQSKGSFLYVQLLLDMIERGYLVIRDDDYSIMPKDLSELFLLQFNLR